MPCVLILSIFYLKQKSLMWCGIRVGTGGGVKKILKFSGDSDEALNLISFKLICRRCGREGGKVLVTRER